MSSLLKSTLNTRVLPIDNIPIDEMRYIRSDVPLHLTKEEIQWLLDHDISILVDLRSSQELEQKPCPLQNIPGFTYCHLPVTGGESIPKSRPQLNEIYRGMIDKQMDTILETILKAPSNVMYFCTAGKDRTGVVSALLLKHLGVSEDVIVEDYMKSKENLFDMLTAYARNHPEIDIDLLIPQEENIKDVLSYDQKRMKKYKK